MKKLAINSFLAITAMAWGGGDLRAGPRQSETPDTFVEQESSSSLDRRGYDARARALLAAWHASRRADANDDREVVTPVVGQRLAPELMQRARTVPADIRRQLGTDEVGLVDLLVGSSLVRVERATLLVLDVMA